MKAGSYIESKNLNIILIKTHGQHHWISIKISEMPVVRAKGGIRGSASGLLFLVKGDDIVRRQIDNFLQTYKELEALVQQNHNKTIFEYENDLDSTDSKKLQICRILRNYIQHNEDGYDFVAISDDMQKFLESLTISEKAKELKNKDMMVKPFSKKLISESVLSAAKLLISKNLEFLPVLNEKKQLTGVVTKENMIRVAYLYDLTSCEQEFPHFKTRKSLSGEMNCGKHG